MTPPRRIIWVISDGRRGIENQARGLAEALTRLKPSIIIRKIIGSDPSFAKLPPSLQLLKRAKPAKYSLAAPYPDIMIGCGRQAIAPMRAVKKANPKSYAVYIQDPRSSYDHFDLIIAPEHDRLNRANAVSMIGSPNRVTAQRLEVAAQDFKAQVNNYPTPRAALLIGGPSKRQTITSEIIAAHINAAQSLMATGHSLFITLSRRTDNASRRAWTALAVNHRDKIWLYDGVDYAAGPNPYFAFLKAADIIGVTEDSTNMLTEACASGTSVFRLPMAGDAGKFERLYSALESRCHIKLFTPNTEYKAYAPLDETTRIAQVVYEKYEAFRGSYNT